MSHFFKSLFIAVILILSGSLLVSATGIGSIPGASEVASHSIIINTGASGGDAVETLKGFGLKILSVARVVISGFALVYLVMIGVYMIIGSDSEEKIKSQKNQITIALIGFLFLNIPSMVYNVFLPGVAGGGVVADNHVSWGNSTILSPLWNPGGFEGLLGNIIAFLQVFIFGAAVLTFTWGLFNMVISGGDDEKRKQAKNRIVYGLVGLIFMGFVKVWGTMIAGGDFQTYIPKVGNVAFSLVMYFAAPISIFMLIWAGYYWITSAGDEERIKKGKSIIINTGIALTILITALSFITEISTFKL